MPISQKTTEAASPLTLLGREQPIATRHWLGYEFIDADAGTALLMGDGALAHQANPALWMDAAATSTVAQLLGERRSHSMRASIYRLGQS